MFNLNLILQSCLQALLLLLPTASHLTDPTTAVGILPLPAGRFGVGMHTAKWTDTDRIDPFSPTHELRSVMVSVFYPMGTCLLPELVSYMPTATAELLDNFYAPYGLPRGSFPRLKLQLCGRRSETRVQNDLIDDGVEARLVLFSPGLGSSRLLHSALAQAVASFGYVVVTIDHPYDANVVEYPDGTLVLSANISTEAQIELAVRTRAQDISFVLDQLGHRKPVRRLLPFLRGDLRTRSVAAFGHSLGGAATAAAMEHDDRIFGGVNLDGRFFGTVIKNGLGRPFLLFGNEHQTDPSWSAIWPKFRAWKLELRLKGAQHGTFSDLPLLVKVLDLADVLPPEVGGVLGTLDGERVVHLLSAYLVTFFDLVLHGKSGRLLEAPDSRYPEVEFVKKGHGHDDIMLNSKLKEAVLES